MYFIYSIVYTFGSLVMLPAFLWKREKYASGFRQRLGNYPEFKHDGRKAIWLHCVSVGETNAARPLVDKLIEEFPDHRLIISTITKTGQKLAQKIFADKADAVFYFPFDWKFSVRRALANFKPSLVILMETEIWPQFIHEAKRSGARLAIVNGRLSARSFGRYSRVRSFVKRVLSEIDVALMQTEADAKRIVDLGIDDGRAIVTGNLKFEQSVTETENAVTELLRARFDVTPNMPLIIAASTHEPEERYVLESLDGELGHSCRLMIAPRHPERFDAVQKVLRSYPYSFVRRTAPQSDDDKNAAVILLDSIGELRAAYPLAEIVFVGGSLVPHGGQSVLEPAAVGKAIVTGPYTHNFDAVVKEFLGHNAIRQIRPARDGIEITERLKEEFKILLNDQAKRAELGANAAAVMTRSDRGMVKATVDALRTLVDPK